MGGQANAERLRRIAASMDGAFGESERTCLAVGERLAAAVEVFGRLGAAFDALPAALNGPEMHRAAEVLRQVAHRVAEMGQGLPAETAALTALGDRTQGVTDHVERLRRSVRTIAILAINAKIEGAALRGGGVDFTGFTEELSQLARTAQDTVEGYGRENDRLVTLLLSSCKAQTAFEHSHQGKLFAVAAELDESVAALQGRREQVAAAAAEIGRRSRQIAQAVGSAVLALQIGDITRQRIEHVHEALRLLADNLGPEGIAADDEERSRAIAAVCRLQSVQVTDALTDFETEVGKVAASLHDLASDAGGLVRLGGDLYGGAEANGGSFVQVLKRRLDAAEDLIRDCQAARGTVDRVTTAVAQTLVDLQEHLARVSAVVVDITLVGMNAVLKSGRLGAGGKGLGVIAQELRAYANEIMADAGQLKPALAAIVEAARGFESERLAQGADLMAEIDHDMAGAVRAFEQTAGAIAAALDGLARNGEEVASILADAARSLDETGALGTVLRGVQAELDAIVAEAGPQDHDLTGSPFAELLMGNYTMASERKAHLAVSGGRTGGAVLAAAAEPALDDVLF